MQGKLETNVNSPLEEKAVPALQAAAAAPSPAAPLVKKAPPPPKPPEEVKEKSLDDIILEFLEQEDKK
jgi:hypothetical protein